MFILMFVLDNIDRLDDLAIQWQESGALGINVLESSRVQLRPALRFPLVFARGEKAACELVGRYTLFTLVPDSESLQRCIQVAEQVTGGPLGQGMLAAWPVAVGQDTSLAPLPGEPGS